MFKLYVEGLDGALRVAVLTRAEMAEYQGPIPTYIRVGSERVSWATFKAICSTCIHYEGERPEYAPHLHE